jgi:hypothetical protein
MSTVTTNFDFHFFFQDHTFVLCHICMCCWGLELAIVNTP